MIYLTRVLGQRQPSLSSPSRPHPTRLSPVMQASRSDVEVESPATMTNERKDGAPQSSISVSRLGRLLRALKIKKAGTTPPPMDEQQNVYVVPSVQPAAELYPSTMNFEAFIIELHRTSDRYPSSVFLPFMKASEDDNSFSVASPSSSASLEDGSDRDSSSLSSRGRTRFETIEEEQSTEAVAVPGRNECHLSGSYALTGKVPFVEGDSSQDFAASAEECDEPQDSEKIPAEVSSANDTSLSSYSLDTHESNDLQTTEVKAEMTD